MSDQELKIDGQNKGIELSKSSTSLEGISEIEKLRLKRRETEEKLQNIQADNRALKIDPEQGSNFEKNINIKSAQTDLTSGTLKTSHDIDHRANDTKVDLSRLRSQPSLKSLDTEEKSSSAQNETQEVSLVDDKQKNMSVIDHIMNALVLLLEAIEKIIMPSKSAHSSSNPSEEDIKTEEQLADLEEFMKKNKYKKRKKKSY